MAKRQLHSQQNTSIHTISQKDPNIIDCNMKKNYQILVIFGKSISETTGHQMAVWVPTSPNVCFCTTWEKQQNITFFIQNSIFTELK